MTNSIANLATTPKKEVRKVLFIGDPHLKINRFELSTKFLTWVTEAIIKTKPDLVVNLGDTFDTHAVLRSEVIGEFMKHVDIVLEAGIPYVYLLGNHDMFKPNDSTYHALRHLKGKIPNFYIVDEDTDLFGMSFVPYKPKEEMFPTRTLPICVAHQTFKGADYGDIVMQKGVDSEAVSADIIISGHVHKKQVLGKVVYPGSPFSQGVKDINQVKGLLVLNTETLDQTFIECPLPKWRGITCEIGPSFSVEDLHATLGTELTSTDHWFVDVTGPKAEIDGYFDSKQWKAISTGIDVKKRANYTDKEKKQIKLKARSMDSIISEYFAKIYSGSLDKTTLTKRALDVLLKVRQGK